MREFNESELAELQDIEAKLLAAKQDVTRLSAERHKLLMRGKARRLRRILHLLREDEDPNKTSRLPEYFVWAGLRNRCLSEKNTSWKDYGGRGITVCERWAESFENFLLDMGRRPEGTSIDRIDNDGNYEPGNCRWATLEEQSKNKRPPSPQLNPRPSIKYVVNGVEMTVPEIAKAAGVSHQAIRQRIGWGWSSDDLIKPPQQKG